MAGNTTAIKIEISNMHPIKITVTSHTADSRIKSIAQICRQIKVQCQIAADATQQGNMKTKLEPATRRYE